MSNLEEAAEIAYKLQHSDMQFRSQEQIDMLSKLATLLDLPEVATAIIEYDSHSESEILALEAKLVELKARREVLISERLQNKATSTSSNLQHKILILTGHSGSGKDTISALLQRYNRFVPIIPHSTRAMRSGESDGNPYHFINVSTFGQMAAAGEFIEHKSYVTQFAGFENTAYYGTAYSSIPIATDSVITIGVNAAIELKQKLGANAIVVYLHVSDEVREARARERGSFDKIEWDNRLSQDHARFKDGLPAGIDIIINNTASQAQTVTDILNYVHTQKLKDINARDNNTTRAES